jgi:YidC/Oxa1 family membrane protein insertase
LANRDIFKQEQEQVMGYTTSLYYRILLAGIFAPMMNQLMTWTYSWVHNWGLAIIIGTLLIKIVTLPFNLTAAKSAKKMQALQPEMKALNEKYKDNQQKRTQAMMELYKQRGVNPMGGCLPMLLPLPFFIGFFSMLQSAPELRFAEFLWVKDLAGPDTVAHVGGFAINVLPIVLGAVMIVQMRLVPQPASMDSEQAQMMAKMMKWMPLVYVVLCYSFSCALSLYSTVNGLFMIGQQLYVNRLKNPELRGAPVTAGGAATRLVKNVTPGKKKAK